MDKQILPGDSTQIFTVRGSDHFNKTCLTTIARNLSVRTYTFLNSPSSFPNDRPIPGRLCRQLLCTALRLPWFNALP